MRAWLRTSERDCSSAFRLFTLVVAFSTLTGCPKGGGRPVVKVEILERRGMVRGEIEKLDLRAEEKRLEKIVDAKLPGFRVREKRGDEIGWQLTATVERSEGDRALPDDAGVVSKDHVLRGVRIEWRLISLGVLPGKKTHSEFQAQVLLAKNTPLFGGFGALLAEGFEQAAREIALEIELRDASPKKVVERLGSKDASARARAVDVARERKLKEAVPALIGILDDDGEETSVVFKTIGALIAIGDPKAVGPLIDSARRRPPMYLDQIIFGVAQIGGKQAEAYLFTVSSGHADPNVRKNAKDALEELTKRKRRAKKEPEP